MGLEYDSRKKDGLKVERKSIANKNKLQLSSEVLRENDIITPQFDDENSVTDLRYVPVDISDDFNKKKKLSKVRSQSFNMRCSVYEKKLIELKAKHSRLSVSEFCRRAVFRVEIKERMSDQHIEIYKTLVKYHHNLKVTGNMFRKSDPELTKGVYQLANQIKAFLLNITK